MKRALVPPLGSPTLLLFPTELELLRFRDRGGLPYGLALRAICGFGPVLAGARTMQLLTTLRPRRALLVGIAGAYDTETHPIGTAHEPARVALHGVGAGEGEAFQGPPSLGFPQWPGSPDTTAEPVVDEVALPRAPASSGASLLLTTCAASSSPEEAARRRERHPDAVLEDMEGFAVAAACALARVPLRIVRGVSNTVGDRSPENWRIPGALAAARESVIEILEDESWDR